MKKNVIVIITMIALLLLNMQYVFADSKIGAPVSKSEIEDYKTENSHYIESDKDNAEVRPLAGIEYVEKNKT
ncbi:MAG: hypothetical protein NUV45_14985 [Tepidanaerobacteraceae bacterium]|jgi:hypothetical protein|nr:hypothetical protein [Tepidanaerobacteraceae bacterium]